MSETKLEAWRKSATRRAEFAVLLQEPAMVDAIEIVKEIIFVPFSVPPGLSPADRMAHMGEMGLRREMYLSMLNNFLNLAKISPQKTNAQALQKKKPWDTVDRKAGEAALLNEFYGGNPPPVVPPQTGPTEQTTETVLPVSTEPEQTQ